PERRIGTEKRNKPETPRRTPPRARTPLVPTVLRGNAVCDAPRRVFGGPQPKGTQSVPDGIPTRSVGTRVKTRPQPPGRKKSRSPIPVGSWTAILGTGPVIRTDDRPGMPGCPPGPLPHCPVAPGPVEFGRTPGVASYAWASCPSDIPRGTR